MNRRPGPHLLGRTLEHDPLSRNFPYPILKPYHPTTRLWDCRAPILDQGEIGSCEGNTAVEWANCAVNISNRVAYRNKRNYKGRAYLSETDAVSFYSAATGLDNDQIPGVYPPDDTGTSAVGIAKAMQAAGIIAKYQWTFGWDHFCAAMETGPVMLGTNWYTQMFTPNVRGVCIIGGKMEGGHAYLARGIDYQKQLVRCRNHWTTDWGYHGEFYLRFDVLQQLLSEQGDVLVPVKM